MSRLSVPEFLEADTGPSGQIYAQLKKAIGSVPNTYAPSPPTAPLRSRRCLPPMPYSLRAR